MRRLRLLLPLRLLLLPTGITVAAMAVVVAAAKKCQCINDEEIVKNTRAQATILCSFEKTEEEHKNTRLFNCSGNSFKASCVHFICTACQEHKNTSHNLAFICKNKGRTQ